MESSQPFKLSNKVVILLCSAALLSAFYLNFSLPVKGLVARWLKFDEAYSHGLLILAIVIYLLLVSKTQLLQAIKAPNYPALILLAALSLVCAISIEAGIELIQQLLIPALIWLGFTALFGLKFGYKLLIPIGFLYYAVPFWDYLSIVLQLITVEVCEFFLRLFNIPAYITGVEIHLPSGIIKVAHGCSGLRYLLVGMTISSLYAVLYLHGWQKRSLLIFTAILLALTANWLRVLIIIFEGHRTSMASPLMHDHDYFGWFIFAITLIPVFFLGHWLQGKVHSSTSLNNDTPATTTLSSTKAPASNTLLLSHTAMIILLGFYLPIEFISQQQTLSFTPLTLENNLTSWHKSTVENSLAIKPILHGYEQQLEAAYVDSSKGSSSNSINLQLYIYPTQKQQHELIQYNNKLINEKNWAIIEKQFLSINNTPMVMAQLKHQHTQKQYLLLYTYYISGGFYADDTLAKLASLKGFINGRRDGTVIMLSTACNESCGDTQQLAADFIEKNRNAIKAGIDASFLNQPATQF